MKKINIGFLIISLICFIFFLIQAYSMTKVNISNLYKIVEIREMLNWAQWGVYAFYIGFILLLFSKKTKVWVVVIIAYLSLWFLMRDLFTHLYNANQMFNCSLNYQQGCIEYVDKFEKIDLNIMNFNMILLVLLISTIIVGILTLLKNSIIRYDKSV